MEAASETTTDQEDQTKDRESGGEKELTKGTGKAYIYTTHIWGILTQGAHGPAPNGAKQQAFCLIKHILNKMLRAFLNMKHFLKTP